MEKDIKIIYSTLRNWGMVLTGDSILLEYSKNSDPTKEPEEEVSVILLASKDGDNCALSKALVKKSKNGKIVELVELYEHETPKRDIDWKGKVIYEAVDRFWDANKRLVDDGVWAISKKEKKFIEEWLYSGFSLAVITPRSEFTVARIKEEDFTDNGLKNAIAIASQIILADTYGVSSAITDDKDGRYRFVYTAPYLKEAFETTEKDKTVKLDISIEDFINFAFYHFAIHASLILSVERWGIDIGKMFVDMKPVKEAKGKAWAKISKLLEVKE